MNPEEYNTYLNTKLQQDATIPQEAPFKNAIGKSILGLMQPQLPYIANHDVIPLLNEYAEKWCPVECGPDWDPAHIHLMLEGGPHRSANSNQAKMQLQAETLDKFKHNYARTVTWGEIKNDIPPS